ncbi:MAG: hypothetical protein ABFR82_06405 [Nitrospirota bacterium]
MINLIAGNIGNLLDAAGRSGRSSSIKAGTVLKAEVIDVSRDANVLKSVPANVKSMNPELNNLENLLTNSKQINAKRLTSSARSLLTLSGRAGSALAIKPGTIVNAEVIKISGEGTTVLRLAVPGCSNSIVQEFHS